MAKLTDVQVRCLRELAAACNERMRLYGVRWVRTYDLSGSPAERSSKTLNSLCSMGFVMGEKPEGCRQTQYRWRITEAGRAALKEEEGRG